MIYTIKLASNYQVVEFEINGTDGIDLNSKEIQEAIKLVNYLGESVEADPKKGKKKTSPENLATERQKEKLDSMGISYPEDISRQDAWKLIDKHTKK